MPKPAERPAATRLYLIRHAHAGSRSEWKGLDANRPLSPRGAAQARVIASQLADAGIDRLWSSPSLRCRQTLDPLAERLGIAIEAVEPFDEGAEGAAALDAALAAAAQGATLAVCSHGDVLPAVAATALRRGAELVGGRGLPKAARHECDLVDGQIARLTLVKAPDGET